jgi:CheY-like chemotaxis protein
MNPTEPTKGAGGDAQGDGLSAMPPLSMVTIALNRETQGLLRLYLSSLPLNLRVELADYGPNEVEEIPEWLGGEPEICIVDFDTEPDKASACAETIRSHNPEIAIFGVSSNAKPEAIVEAMRSGCNEYLLKPLTSSPQTRPRKPAPETSPRTQPQNSAWFPPRYPLRRQGSLYIFPLCGQGSRAAS